MRSFKCSLIAVVFFLSALQISAADFFTDQGSFWLGGNVSYLSVGYENGNYRQNGISLISTTRIFPAKFFFVGPSINWNSSFNKDYNSNSLAVGADIGCAFGEGIPVVPYFRSGGLFNVYGYHNDGDHNSFHGFTIPIAGGVIIPLFDVVALQIEPAFYFKRIDGNSYNIFAVSFGFCGLGKRSAVSLLNQFTL